MKENQVTVRKKKPGTKLETSLNGHWVMALNQTFISFYTRLRTCSLGGGGPQVGEVPRLGGVTNLSIQSLFFSWLLSHERWGTSPRRVARSAVSGNPLRWGKFSPCECWRWGGVMFSWAFIHYYQLKGWPDGYKMLNSLPNISVRQD